MLSICAWRCLFNKGKFMLNVMHDNLDNRACYSSRIERKWHDHVYTLHELRAESPDFISSAGPHPFGCSGFLPTDKLLARLSVVD
mmetsp:Transcript_28723/g.55297  ORF Transcript_28723/g.55297 Transcript_28723/m.55297 type:complete len:85 (-) Transcript_28723:71-325(-)